MCLLYGCAQVVNNCSSLQCKGLIHNRGGHLTGQKETEAADEMRLAVFDALCRDEQRAKEFEEVNYSVENLEGGKTA